MPSFFTTVQLLAAAALIAVAAAQDVTCKPFSPIGSTSTKARIYFYNNVRLPRLLLLLLRL
jgi:hypothetical protein